MLCWITFRKQIRHPSLMNWQPESKAKPSAEQRETGHVSHFHPSADKRCHSSHLILRNGHQYVSMWGDDITSAIVACACSWILFSYHVMSWKHWHLRRKVKAKKSQRLQNHRVGIPFITCAMQTLFFVFSFSFSLCLYISKLYSINFTAEDDNDDMFRPPKLEDEDFSPFGGKSGLFSGGRGLFDDDDEVSYIFFILCILRFQKLAGII